MDAREVLRSGNLAGALEQLKQEVRKARATAACAPSCSSCFA